MNILYGIQTTGHGHYIRSRATIRELKKRGHTVKALLSGPPLKGQWDVSIFDPYQIKTGFTFITEKGRVRPVKTAFALRYFEFFRDVYFYDTKNIDLVICDFEPVTARIAQLRGIPSVGIGHMHAFAHNVPVPGSAFYDWVLNTHAPVKYPIGLHWHHYDQPILPPTIPPEVVAGPKVVKNKILVYMGFEEHEEVVAFLKPIKSHDFYIYSRVDAPEDIDNIHIRPFSRTGFLTDLQECGGVLANAGFSLASEALHLGKKLLLRPILKQYEHEANCLALLQGKLGSVMPTLDTEAVREWLTFPPIQAMNYSDVITPFIDWIEKGTWWESKQLVQDTWASSAKALEAEYASKNFGWTY